MIVFSNAKINIGLSIGDKREDGYHNLTSIFYPIPLCDVLEINKAEQDSFKSYGIEINTTSNLILDAITLLRQQYEIPPLSVNIFKRIPLGAGLGGGSSNGTYTLKVLNTLFELNLDHEELHKLALKLGSDCPFFLHNKPSLVKGRGEIIEGAKLDLSGMYLKLVYPNIHSSTAEAFSGLNKDRKQQIFEFDQWKNLSNDFETSIFKLYPQIEQTKKKLSEEGAIYSAMTGTGSSVFGIFESKPENVNRENEFILDL